MVKKSITSVNIHKGLNINEGFNVYQGDDILSYIKNEQVNKYVNPNKK